MITQYRTNRLFLTNLDLNDSAFIKDLVNTLGWLQFIGDRNVHSLSDAAGYIARILENQNISYYVVRLNDNSNPIGIITFIKRDYLDFHDLGFAFLPEYAGNGFAFEAANIVLKDKLNDPLHSTILATTIKTNIRSQRLLERLGFSFDREIVNQGEPLLIYRISS